MRAINIRVSPGVKGISQMKASFQKNWRHYLQEALGLAIFMISACFFGAILEGKHTPLHDAIPHNFLRMIIMGILMGITALFIFYSPFTAPSGSHINPAVTMVFLRLGKMSPWDAFFYIIFQIMGGTMAVYAMSFLLGNSLTDKPVNFVTTVPGKMGILPAIITEFLTAFIMITMVLFTSSHETFKKYTRIIAGCFVCLYVILAGPISGFGMNPARSLASALPAHTYTAFWVYMVFPFVGMLLATEFFIFLKRKTRCL